MFEIFNLKTIETEKGSLTPIELHDFIDFEVRRVYTVHNSFAKDRGGHSHFVEKEFFFMTSGTCKAKIHDGEKWIEFEMRSNETAVYVGENVWHEFLDFSKNAVLVALSSTNYNPDRNDYEENFEKFQAAYKLNTNNFKTNV